MSDARPLDERLGPLLGRAHAAHRAVVERALGQLGLDLGVKEFGALSLLERHGPLSQRRLGELQGIDRTTMVAVVDALERKGLAERRRDPADRRVYSLRATDEGRRALARAGAAIDRAEDDALAGVAPAEQRRLKELLRRIAGIDRRP
jgi:DNA-binding MarR family transcriptional regulator